MKVSEWIARHPHNLCTIPPDGSVEAIIDLLLSEPTRRDIYVLSPAGHILGHISYHRIACLLLEEHRPTQTRRQLFERISRGTADEIMNSHVISAEPDEELEDTLQRLLDHGLEDMPVIDADGMALGAINLGRCLESFRAGLLGKGDAPSA